jgi:hypothetical protein
MAKAKAGPVVSDNGNFIIDAPFSREEMMNPYTVRRIASLLMSSADVILDHGKDKDAHRCCRSWLVLPYGTSSVLW